VTSAVMTSAGMTNGHVIRTRALTKRYGDLRAVDGVNLEVRVGDVYGFLGANGSGKTTTVRILLGLVLATSGEAEVLGMRMPTARSSVLPRIGSLVESPAAYPHLSGTANLALLDATGSDRSPRQERRTRIAIALEQVGLDPSDRRPVRAYSQGMRQRLGLAAALMRRPTLLILDEPSNGLDPQGIQEIRRLLLHLNSQGTTIFLSSHLLAEIEQMCTRVGVLRSGQLILQEQLDALLQPTGLVAVRTPDLDRCTALLGAYLVSVADDRLLVRGQDPARLNAYLVGESVRVDAIGPYRRTLEQVVLEAEARA
jgi:ABC-type multidrug transport system ATPase subunit